MVLKSEWLDQSFPSTQWLLVNRGHAALGELFEQYHGPMCAYFTARGVSRANAEDMVQAFVLTQMIENDLLGRADQSRGRFRSLLCTALDRFAAKQYQAGRAKKRRPTNGHVIPLADQDPPDNGANPSNVFYEVWAKKIVHETVGQMKTYCQAVGRMDIWLIMERRLLAPILENEPACSYEQLQQELELASPGQASNLLITGKRIYARIMRGIIAKYALNEAEVEEEISELFSFLSQSGA